MRHSQLRAFHHVALLGGFSRAAEALRLSQPVLSQQVRALEQDHDVLLLSRARKQVVPTPAGERLLHLTRQYFAIEAEIAEHLGEASVAVRGTLRIVADSAHHITAILARFRRRHPGVAVTLRTRNTDEVLDALRNFDAEIGVAGAMMPGPDMDSVRLGSSEIVAFAAHGLLPVGKHRLEMRELPNWPLIFREPGSKTRQKVLDAAKALGVELTPAIEAEGREAVREVVASGAGIGFVSRAEFGSDARLQVIPLAGTGDGDRIVMRETLACLSRRREVRAIRAFMDLARAGGGDAPHEP